MRQGTVPLGRLLGVEIRIHPLLLLWVLWTSLDAWWTEGEDRWSTLVLVLIALLSLLLHEWAHARVAKRLGRVLGPVILGPISVSWVSSRDAPWEDAAIAGAGPASNLVVAALTAGFLATAAERTALHSLCSVALWTNLALGVLNLVPIHPLDGGKLLFALLSVLTTRERAWRSTLWSGLVVGTLSTAAAWSLLPSPWCFAAILVGILTIVGPARALRAASSSPLDVQRS